MRKIDIAGNVVDSLLSQLKTTAITCSHQFASNKITVAYSKDGYVLGHVFVGHENNSKHNVPSYCWQSWDGTEVNLYSVEELASAIQADILYPSGANNRRNYGKAKLNEFWAKAYAADSGLSLA